MKRSKPVIDEESRQALKASPLALAAFGGRPPADINPGSIGEVEIGRRGGGR
jgi:hypothetical protein